MNPRVRAITFGNPLILSQDSSKSIISFPSTSNLIEKVKVFPLLLSISSSRKSTFHVFCKIRKYL